MEIIRCDWLEDVIVETAKRIMTFCLNVWVLFGYVQLFFAFIFALAFGVVFFGGLGLLLYQHFCR